MKNISHYFRKNLEEKQKLEKLDNCEFSDSYKIFENKCRLWCNTNCLSLQEKNDFVEASKNLAGYRFENDFVEPSK